MLEYSILRDESIIEYNPLVSHLTEPTGQGNYGKRGRKKVGGAQIIQCPTRNVGANGDGDVHRMMKLRRE